MHISPTRRRQESSTRLDHSLAGTSTAQEQANVMKKPGAMRYKNGLLTWLDRNIAAQTMHNKSASTADIDIEPASSPSQTRGVTVTGKTIGSCSATTGVPATLAGWHGPRATGGSALATGTATPLEFARSLAISAMDA